jgi:predicted Zn-dependent protease
VNQPEKDLTAGKIKLIYEFNVNSPLFARVAAMEIDCGNILEAIKILERGINLYPSYAASYFILALANAYSGKDDEAKTLAAQGAELLGLPDTLNFYNKKIDKITAERNSLSEAKRHTFTATEEKTKVEKSEPSLLEDRLDLLAEQLSKAKIVPKDLDESSNDDFLHEVPLQKIVSETMAEIYFAQKNYDEAISTYEELINQKPEKAELYLQKIADIRSLTNDFD